MKKTALLATLAPLILGLTLGAIPFASAQVSSLGPSDDKDKPPVTLLVPPALAGDKSLAGGCWVRLYDGINLHGELLTIAGPTSIPTPRVGPNYTWNLKIDSLSVGPNATLTIWGDQHYKGTSTTFKPGQEVSVLGEHFAKSQKIQSLRIECSK
ncbi:MAG: hypothetical protein L0H15_09140 [Nitrosospira sp.]|nr:hypothetical protein [Nitrosospira sp.]MDN5880771.1 hypothetical protein [Nitrosospira sp.]MDN5934933.1 hypothetical protein [Nitrosospira sp.]